MLDKLIFQYRIYHGELKGAGFHLVFDLLALL